MGYGESNGGNVISAYAWSGNSAGDAVNIGPTGYTETLAAGIEGNTIVGSGINGSISHALIWSGLSSADATLLDSTGYSSTGASRIIGNLITGYGVSTATGVQEAIVWTGTNYNTILDLNQFLSPGYSHVYATGVNARRDICGYGTNSSGTVDALLWKVTAAPEPSMLILPALGLLGILKRKFKA